MARQRKSQTLFVTLVCKPSSGASWGLRLACAAFIVALLSGCPSPPDDNTAPPDAGPIPDLQEDLPPAPEDAADDVPQDTPPDDVPAPTLPPLVCQGAQIDGQCVPEAFLGRDAGPLPFCQSPAMTPVPARTAPDCEEACRGPQTPPSALYEVPPDTPVHAPVTGTIIKVVSNAPARPTAPDYEGCQEAPDGQWCCHQEDGPGNEIQILDRKGFVWTLSHLAPDSIQVQTGQVIQAGMPLATAGHSGFICAPPQTTPTRVHLQVQHNGAFYAPTACLTPLETRPIPPELCIDNDGDTYGQGQGCDTTDCDDTDPALQSWQTQPEGCLREATCADRDNDGAFAGVDCPWPDEDCDDTDPQRTTGCQQPPCQCSQGPCCDGCRFKDGQTVCAQAINARYSCQGGPGCGQDIQVALIDRLCTGDSPQCDGPEVERPPAPNTACTAERLCIDGDFTCVPDPQCAADCQQDDDCQSDQHCQQGACTGDLCPKGEPFCAGNTLMQCSVRGERADTVETCANGCRQGACLACPQNFCSQNNLDDGTHCDGHDAVTCASADGCAQETQRSPCGAGLCDQGQCLQCLGDGGCPSPLQACTDNACACQNQGCQLGDAGCLPDGTRWQCVQDTGGCLHRAVAPCGPFEVCQEGTCQSACPPGACAANGWTEGLHCDGIVAVECGIEEDCPVDLTQTACTGQTPICDQGQCLQCLGDSDCPSPLQTCTDNACTCQDQCQPDTQGCFDDTQAWTCQPDPQGCLAPSPVPCGPNERCIDGACTLFCPDNVCQNQQWPPGDHCDGSLRVTCRQLDGCLRPRTWQPCPCGCRDNACQPCDQPEGPTIDVGLGETAFNAVQDGAVAGVFAGFQGGHHVFGALRAHNLPQRTGTQQTWSVEHQGRELARWTVFRDLRADDGFDLWFGETVQFELGTDPRTLDGLRATLSVTLVTVDNVFLYDEVDVVLSYTDP